MYMIKGVTSSPSRAGAKAPFSHVTHGEEMTTPISVASFRHSRFCAAAVRNRAEVCTEPWNCACTRNLPSLPADWVPVCHKQLKKLWLWEVGVQGQGEGSGSLLPFKRSYLYHIL